MTDDHITAEVDPEYSSIAKQSPLETAKKQTTEEEEKQKQKSGATSPAPQPTTGPGTQQVRPTPTPTPTPAPTPTQNEGDEEHKGNGQGPLQGPPRPAPQKEAAEEPPVQDPSAFKNNSGVWVKLGDTYVNHANIDEEFFKKNPEYRQEYNNIRANPTYKDVFKDLDPLGYKEEGQPGENWSKATKLADTIGGAFIEANLPKNVQRMFTSFRNVLGSTLNGDLLGAVGSAVDSAFNAITLVGDGVNSFKSKVKQNYGYSAEELIGNSIKARMCKRELDLTQKALSEEVENMVKLGNESFDYLGRREDFQDRYFPKGSYDRAQLGELGFDQAQADTFDKVVGGAPWPKVTGTGVSWSNPPGFTDEEKKDLVYMLKTGDYGYNKDLMGKFIGAMNGGPNPYQEAVHANQTYDFSTGLGDWAGHATKLSPEEGLRKYYAEMCKKRAELASELEADRLGFRIVMKEDGSGDPELDANGNPKTEPVSRMCSLDRRILSAKKMAYDQAIKGLESGSGGLLRNEIALQANRITSEQKTLKDLQDAKIRQYEQNPAGGAYRILAGRKDGDIAYAKDFASLGVDVPENVKERGHYKKDQLYDSIKEIERKNAGTPPERLSEFNTAYATLCNAYAIMDRGDTLRRQIVLINDSDVENKEKLIEDLSDEYVAFVKERPWMGQNIPYMPYSPVNLVEWGRKTLSPDISDKDVGPQDLRSIFPSADVQGTILVDPSGNVQYFDTDGRPLKKSLYNLLDDSDQDRMEGLRGAWDKLYSKYRAGQPMTSAEHREYASLQWLMANQIRTEVRNKLKGILDSKYYRKEYPKYGAKDREILAAIESSSALAPILGWNSENPLRDIPDMGAASLANTGWNPDWDFDKKADYTAAKEWMKGVLHLDLGANPSSLNKYLPTEEEMGTREPLNVTKGKRLIPVQDTIKDLLKPGSKLYTGKNKAKLDRIVALRDKLASPEGSQLLERLEFARQNGTIQDYDFTTLKVDDLPDMVAEEIHALSDLGYIGGKVGDWSRRAKETLEDNFDKCIEGFIGQYLGNGISGLYMQQQQLRNGDASEELMKLLSQFRKCGVDLSPMGQSCTASEIFTTYFRKYYNTAGVPKDEYERLPTFLDVSREAAHQTIDALIDSKFPKREQASTAKPTSKTQTKKEQATQAEIFKNANGTCRDKDLQALLAEAAERAGMKNAKVNADGMYLPEGKNRCTRYLTELNTTCEILKRNRDEAKTPEDREIFDTKLEKLRAYTDTLRIYHNFLTRKDGERYKVFLDHTPVPDDFRKICEAIYNRRMTDPSLPKGEELVDEDADRFSIVAEGIVRDIYGKRVDFNNAVSKECRLLGLRSDWYGAYAPSQFSSVKNSEISDDIRDKGESEREALLGKGRKSKITTTNLPDVVKIVESMKKDPKTTKQELTAAIGTPMYELFKPYFSATSSKLTTPYIDRLIKAQDDRNNAIILGLAKDVKYRAAFQNGDYSELKKRFGGKTAGWKDEDKSFLADQANSNLEKQMEIYTAISEGAAGGQITLGGSMDCALEGGSFATFGGVIDALSAQRWDGVPVGLKLEILDNLWKGCGLNKIRYFEPNPEGDIKLNKNASFTKFLEANKVDKSGDWKSIADAYRKLNVVGYDPTDLHVYLSNVKVKGTEESQKQPANAGNNAQSEDAGGPGAEVINPPGEAGQPEEDDRQQTTDANISPEMKDWGEEDHSISKKALAKLTQAEGDSPMVRLARSVGKGPKTASEVNGLLTNLTSIVPPSEGLDPYATKGSKGKTKIDRTIETIQTAYTGMRSYILATAVGDYISCGFDKCDTLDKFTENAIKQFGDMGPELLDLPKTSGNPTTDADTFEKWKEDEQNGMIPGFLSIATSKLMRYCIANQSGIYKTTLSIFDDQALMGDDTKGKESNKELYGRIGETLAKAPWVRQVYSENSPVRAHLSDVQRDMLNQLLNFIPGDPMAISDGIKEFDEYSDNPTGKAEEKEGKEEKEESTYKPSELVVARKGKKVTKLKDYLGDTPDWNRETVGTEFEYTSGKLRTKYPSIEAMIEEELNNPGERAPAWRTAYNMRLKNSKTGEPAWIAQFINSVYDRIVKKVGGKFKDAVNADHPNLRATIRDLVVGSQDEINDKIERPKKS